MARFTDTNILFTSFGLLLLFLIAGCGGNNPGNQETASFSFIIDRRPLYEGAHQAAAVNAQEFGLPDNLCYAIHIRGPGQTRIPAAESPCGPEGGWGQFKGLFPKGAVVGFPLPKNTYTFSLIGAPKTSSACGGSNLEEVPGTAGRDMAVKIDGETINPDLIYEFASVTATLVESQQEIALLALVKQTGATHPYSFGRHLKQEDWVSPPAVCVPTAAIGALELRGLHNSALSASRISSTGGGTAVYLLQSATSAGVQGSQFGTPVGMKLSVGGAYIGRALE